MATAMSDVFLSPLRYPGGKRKLSNFLKLVVQGNQLLDGDYVEPYAGGASIGLSLLFTERVRRIFINDVDPSVFAFWHCALNETDSLCRLINDTKVTIEEWYRQRSIQSDSQASLIERGFSTFFLNRTNRSGIISGGVIGGKDQKGKWSLDARFNKADLVRRITRIARYRDRICLSQIDALDLLQSLPKLVTRKTLFFLDPPYYVKGQQALYRNYYGPKDHYRVANAVRKLSYPWIVAYDDVREIRALYAEYRVIEYDIQYTAQGRYRGAEVMFCSHSLAIPDVDDPTHIKSSHCNRLPLCGFV